MVAGGGEVQCWVVDGALLGWDGSSGGCAEIRIGFGNGIAVVGGW